ncbi:hypothetical protein D6C83_07426 [Aureobasidium pullulans]|uniref:Uncharacterized protein n=1 Tax=Aureobasidium pullulans TaxID=5580 RepID=A0A4T0B689_AURPU|nr:hypothetical protein D6C83_07426 [Aureobasidium pullulans]
MAELRAPHLPNEVYLRIANHLAACSEDHELFGLRLISQIFTQGVDDHFLRVYYANRMCPATLEGFRILRYMFQDLTLVPSIQELTVDENVGNGFVDMVAYVQSIWAIIQAKLGIENKTALTVRLDDVSNHLRMRMLVRTVHAMNDLVMNSSNSAIDRLEFDMDAPCSMSELYGPERGTALYDPYLVSLFAWLFSELLHPEGPGRLDILLRLHGNVDETAMTMTVKYTRADLRFECLAPLAMDHYTGLLALVRVHFHHCRIAELNIRNCCVDFSWLERFVRYTSTYDVGKRVIGEHQNDGG